MATEGSPGEVRVNKGKTWELLASKAWRKSLRGVELRGRVLDSGAACFSGIIKAGSEKGKKLETRI